MSFVDIPRRLARHLIGDLWIRRHWLRRASDGATDYTSNYWNDTDSQNRRFLIDVIAAHLHGVGTLLEYGSHVGTNLRMIKGRFPGRDISMFAVEPNREAVAFMAEMLPDVAILEAEDTRFIASAFPGRAIDLSIVNSTFCIMSPGRSARVLDKLCRISRMIVIGDNVSNLNGARSEYDVEPIHYRHPFGTMLRERGFELVTVEPSPAPVPHLNGVLVARKVAGG